MFLDHVTHTATAKSSNQVERPRILQWTIGGTTDGTVNGRLVGTKTAAPEEGACFEDADCSNEAACTWSEDVTSVLECQRTGLDEAKAQGKCKSPCETARVKDLIQSSASAFKTCNSNDDCEVGKGLAAIGSRHLNLARFTRVVLKLGR
eukprot:scaffold9096_cov19-Tisochrysis_lutea.AAC.1